MASYEQPLQDEGYSEDPMTVGTVSGAPASANLPAWIEGMSVSQRAGKDNLSPVYGVSLTDITELAIGIINNLPTSEVCEIVRRLRPRLYIDFIQYLPEEVCLNILRFLDPVSLINTVQASRKWMQLALDRQLWEQLYLLEGFRAIPSEIVKFEESLNADRSRSSEDDAQRQPNKRRATPQRLLQNLNTNIDSGDLEMIDADTPSIKQESIFGLPRLRKVDIDENMADVPSSPTRSSISTSYSSQPARLPLENNADNRRLSTAAALPIDPLPIANIFSLTTTDPDGKKRLNWQYLYSQRRRLEANWEAERYTNFQLPHPSHPEEAHDECIYTIQFSGKYLVSGSRDKSLRIWNLDTRRLVRLPLCGHTGSVLCLQFDADPEEDLIVSGSSDATVVLWKFSTGQLIQRLRKAHRESVLNVRFDKRVLVTCSKDKTIKIFNRRPMNHGDLGYPDIPGAVHPVPTYLNNYGYNPAPTAGLPTKPAYSLIGCLEGHHAAVNAVQIYGSEVVSASGDRTVKIWNWPEQTLIRTLIGHTKGIACVQYDGRRIVSGSSDDEVKVFDKETGLEVASLRAHTNLVRTVQAGFGDLPYSEEEDKETARNIDLEYFKAVDSGAVNRTGVSQRGRPRNAGSRKPEDITAYGAKLPPGGGGGKFGRIVSGSYDETIIIWRRDKEGVWRPLHTLRHEEAARVASRLERRTQTTAAPIGPPLSTTSQDSPAPTHISNPPRTAAVTPLGNAPTTPFAPGSDEWYWHLINLTIPQGPIALRNSIKQYPAILRHQLRLRQAISTLPDPDRQSMYNELLNPSNAQQLAAHWNSPQNIHSQASSSTQAPTTELASTTIPAPPTQILVQTTMTQSPAAQTPIQTPTANPPIVHQAQVAPVAPAPAPVHTTAPHHHNHLPDRVFKLQFDARRVICCSQTSVIVGWDFANDDEQIIEASRFFAPIE